MANYNCRLRLFFPGPVELGGGGPSWWREKRTAHPGTAGSGLPPGLGRGLAVTHPRGPAWHRETRPCRHTKRSPGQSAMPNQSVLCLWFCAESHGEFTFCLPACLGTYSWGAPQREPSAGKGKVSGTPASRETGRAAVRGLSMVTSLWAPDSNCGVIKLNSTI